MSEQLPIPLPATEFREVMAAVATPVSVVTTMAGGVPHGTTVSAFTSLSMDPPSVLISLARASNLLHRIRETRRFGLNVLASTQAALATRFASKCDDRFQDVDWALDHGSARLRGAANWLACHVTDLLDGGDHIIVLGRVMAADSSAEAPLVYYRRAFGTHQTIETARAA